MRASARCRTPGAGPEDFVAEVARARCNAVLCCLAPSANPDHAERYPDAPAYLEAFKAAGWRIRAIAVLGQNGGGVRSPHLMQFPQAPIGADQPDGARGASALRLGVTPGRAWIDATGSDGYIGRAPVPRLGRRPLP